MTSVKHVAQVVSTTVVKAKLHEILSQFPEHELDDFHDREEVAIAILEALGGAIEGTAGIVKGLLGSTRGGGNPFFG